MHAQQHYAYMHVIWYVDYVEAASLIQPEE